MNDTLEVALIKEIRDQVSTVSENLTKLSVENGAMRTELKEVKERILDDLSAVQNDYRELSRQVQQLHGDVEALKSRQAPLTTPAAWGALIVSAVVAIRSFFGL